jgi:cardiolipin synthase
MPRWMNAANGLTALRLLLAPPIVAAMWTGRHGLALALFMIAAATDVLDGAAARRFGQETPFGAYLDPIADKCLLSAMFLAMAGAGMVPWWFVAIVLSTSCWRRRFSSASPAAANSPPAFGVKHALLCRL